MSASVSWLLILRVDSAPLVLQLIWRTVAYICTVNLGSNCTLHAWLTGNVLHITALQYSIQVSGSRGILLLFYCLNSPDIRIVYIQMLSKYEFMWAHAVEFVYGLTWSGSFFMVPKLCATPALEIFTTSTFRLCEELSLNFLQSVYHRYRDSCFCRCEKSTVLNIGSGSCSDVGLPFQNPKP